MQGRLPQELKLAGITDYELANNYLETTFKPDFNRRFTVRPAESGSAFVPLAGLELELLLSIHHERTVSKDNVVSFNNFALQLPQGAERMHFARCPVLVHELLDGSLAITHLGQVIGRFNADTGALMARRRGDTLQRRAA